MMRGVKKKARDIAKLSRDKAQRQRSRSAITARHAHGRTHTRAPPHLVVSRTCCEPRNFCSRSLRAYGAPCIRASGGATGDAHTRAHVYRGTHVLNCGARLRARALAYERPERRARARVRMRVFARVFFFFLSPEAQIARAHENNE